MVKVGKSWLLRLEIEEAWHKGNLTIIDEIYAADFTDHSHFRDAAPDSPAPQKLFQVKY